MMETPNHLQGAQGLVGDTDKSPDHYIPVMREGYQGMWELQEHLIPPGRLRESFLQRTREAGRSDILLPLPAPMDTSKGRSTPMMPPAVPQCDVGLARNDPQMDPKGEWQGWTLRKCDSVSGGSWAALAFLGSGINLRRE